VQVQYNYLQNEFQAFKQKLLVQNVFNIRSIHLVCVFKLLTGTKCRYEYEF